MTHRDFECVLCVPTADFAIFGDEPLELAVLRVAFPCKPDILARARKAARILCRGAHLLLCCVGAGDERLRRVLRFRGGALRQHECHRNKDDEENRRYDDQCGRHLGRLRFYSMLGRA
jgi:hypothetical protein